MKASVIYIGHPSLRVPTQGELKRAWVTHNIILYRNIPRVGRFTTLGGLDGFAWSELYSGIQSAE